LRIIPQATGSTTAIRVAGGESLSFDTNGTNTALTIDTSQRVGIGTTSPGELLHVNGNAIVEDRLLLQRLQSSDNLSVLTFSDTLTGSKGNSLSIGNPGGFDVLFHTGGVEKARIDSSGRLLVGTSSDSGGALLQVNGNRVRIATAKTPASASDTGTAGEICWDSSYIYVCTATDTWKRAALSTW
jgi:hypothetical protein